MTHALGLKPFVTVLLEEASEVSVPFAASAVSQRLAGLTQVSMKYNKASKKFNNNLTASSTHGHYQRMEMFKIWSVRL